MDYRNLHDQIEKDLTKGVYKTFPSLQRRLYSILEKVLKLAFVVNADPLTSAEEQILKENSYI